MPGPHPALLPAAVQDGRQVEPAPGEERTGAAGSADLVPADGHRVEPGRTEVDRHLADGLHRVGVHRHAVPARERDDVVERLQGADLVVRPHHGDQRDLVAAALELVAQRVDVEHPVAVDRQQHQLGAGVLGHPERGVEHGVVLDGGHQQASARAGPALRRDQNMPLTARLSASVPPDVQTTSLGRAPRAAASRSRDSSTTRRAARPDACRDEGLPVRASCSASTRAASGSMGVVAAWSRYTLIGSSLRTARRPSTARPWDHPPSGRAHLAGCAA